jgi:hypothetical protein
MLPMIKIESFDGKNNEAGINVIKRIIGKRVDISLFDEGILYKLIIKTGGSLRDLFSCITKSVNIANYKEASTISLEDIDIALSELKSTLMRKIDSRNYDYLAELCMERRQYIENKEMLLEMLYANTVLEYNTDIWHNTHPLIKDFLISIGKMKCKEDD